MLATLLVVLPIFALVFAGWLVRRLGVLGPQATSELNRFVVYLALPALLFDITAHAHWAEVWQPGFIAAFAMGCAVVFIVMIVWRRRGSVPLADAAIDGLNASYANTGFMGFPLAVAAFGPDALPPTLIASILTVCVLFAAAIVLIESSLESDARFLGLILKVSRSLVRNPLLVSPILGALVPLSGMTVPTSGETFLKMLGGAASPCALVALGLFLGESRRKTADQGALVPLVSVKLLLQPALTYVLARFVFALSPASTHVAVLLAGLPTGTGPFMLAEFYRREADVTARAVLVSTVLSLVSVSVYLAAIRS